MIWWYTLIKITLLGQERGVYRWEETLKYFKSSDKYSLVYRKRKSLSGITSFYNRIKRNIRLLFDIASSESVWLLPMSDKDLFFLMYAKVLGKNVIVDYYSSREDVVILNGSVSGLSASKFTVFRYRMLDRMRIFFASKVIFLTEVELRIAKERFTKMNSSKGVVIPLVVPPIEVKKTTEKVNPDNSLNIVWWGGISKLHRLDYIISEINLLDEKIKLWVFDNSKKRIDLFKRHYSDINMDKTTFRSDLTFENGLWEWVSNNADVVLGVFGDTELSKSVVPNKVVQGAYFDKPIVTRYSKAYGEDEKKINNLLLINPEDGCLKNTIKKLDLSKNESESFIEFTNNYSVNNFRARVERLMFNE